MSIINEIAENENERNKNYGICGIGFIIQIKYGNIIDILPIVRIK